MMTEGIRAESTGNELNEGYRSAFETAVTPTAIVSLEGRWLRVNPALTSLLGYSEAELLATTFQSITLPSELPVNLDYLHRALVGEITHYELKKHYVHKDGHTLSALLSTHLIYSNDGRPLYFVSQIHDMTEKARLQIELDRLRFQLAHSGRLALVGQLTAAMVHELLQPITAALGNAEAAQHMITSGQSTSTDMLALLSDIGDSSIRAADIIQRARTLLAKKQRPHHRLSLNHLVQEVAMLVRSDLMLRRVRLLTRLDSSRPEISGDSVELQQVILNLLLNGAEAMSQNTPANRELIITTVTGEHEAELIVQDCGRGVHPAQLDQMFEPFFSTKQDGMGMGLTICADIVRTHRGRLWAENNPVAGLTLHCTLPTVQPGPEERAPAPATAAL